LHLTKVTKENDKKYEKLIKVYNPQNVKKLYDKFTKGYIYEIETGINTRL
jgi:hypothetical protein